MEYVSHIDRAEELEYEGHGNSSEDIAWMGYVGALAGLVIGLLLMIAVVGIGIGVLGRSALATGAAVAAREAADRAKHAVPRVHESAPAQVQAQAQLPALSKKLGGVPITALEPGSGLPGSGAGEGGVNPRAHGQRPAVVLALQFPVGEAVLDAASRQVLADAVKARLAQVPPGAEWLLMALSERGDARLQRLGYLRLLALRNVLLDQQIAAGHIRSESLPANELPSPSAEVVYVALAAKGR